MNNKYFGTSSFYKRALSIALPVMAQLLIQNFVSLIDNFMVAGLGDIKMSGVNVSGQINFIFMILINTICMSGGIFMSQFKGAGDKEGMRQSFKFKIFLTGIFGIAYMFVSFIAPRNLFNLMVTVNKDASAIVDQSVIYSRAVAVSWILMCVSQSIGSSLREIEKVKPPLVISIIATVVNTVFNYILIYGNFGAPRLEVAGAAYATVIARSVELVLFIVYVAVKKPGFVFGIFDAFRINWKLFATLVRKSAMILYSELFWAISETVSNALYNTRGGAEIVSGMAAGFAIANLFFICFSGIVTSSSVIVGQELGAGHIEESRKYKNWILSGATVFGCAFAVLGCCTTILIPVVFKNLTPAAQDTAKELVIVAAAYLPLWAFINAQYSISRTGGDTVMGVICDTVGNALFLAGMFLLAFLTKLGPVAMYAIVKVSDVPKSVIAWIWLKKERWLVNLTKADSTEQIQSQS
ncbi:MATE family efflux transporter [Treponema sp.]|uniref:MATE family efflux transporter n=1 Tax=Treponema sp. TaxID=166 RepID=UPI003FD6C462